MHRIHKRRDVRCIAENSETYSSQGISFDCSKCNDVFSCNAKLQSHMAQDHEQFESTFSSISLKSDGSIYDIYEKCKQCGKLFENELDLFNHETRVHEYGETFDIYPCEECGFRGTDLGAIKTHIAEVHVDGNISDSDRDSNSLEELGI
jgi:uncharacterized C2H2 Zn-finger protein